MIAPTTAAVIRLSVDPGTSTYATAALNRHDSAMPCQRHDRTTPERPAARSAVSTRSSTVNSNLTFTGGSIEIQRHVPEKHRQIRGRRTLGHLIEHVGDEAAVIRGVVDDVQQRLTARHGSLASAHEPEAYALVQRGIRDLVAPGNVPVVDLALRAPQLFQRRPLVGVARRITMLAPLEVRLENPVDDVDVVERMNHVLEQRRAGLGSFAGWQSGNGTEDQLIGPLVVARERAG